MLYFLSFLFRSFPLSLNMYALTNVCDLRYISYLLVPTLSLLFYNTYLPSPIIYSILYNFWSFDAFHFLSFIRFSSFLIRYSQFSISDSIVFDFLSHFYYFLSSLTKLLFTIVFSFSYILYILSSISFPLCSTLCPIRWPYVLSIIPYQFLSLSLIIYRLFHISRVKYPILYHIPPIFYPPFSIHYLQIILSHIFGSASAIPCILSLILYYIWYLVINSLSSVSYLLSDISIIFYLPRFNLSLNLYTLFTLYAIPNPPCFILHPLSSILNPL
jgi:hypothetical protein